MDTEIFDAEGDKKRPLVVFVHGIGMNATFWADPQRARILGGKYPLSILLDAEQPRTSFHDLSGLGYPVLAWSQKRPAGPAMLAVEELKDILDECSDRSDAGIILIGHSRGGLIARRLLQDGQADIRAVITISSPHRGSTTARWVSYISPFSAALKNVLDMGDKEVKGALHRITVFLSGPAIKEMLPDSDFLKGLSSEGRLGVKLFSIGGTDPSLITIGAHSLPGMLTNIIPDRIIPDEMKEGKGDGMVSAESSVYPGVGEHRNFHCSHARIIFDKSVREYIMKIAGSI